MKIGIFGAGSIGCYVGGMLAAAGEAPVLVGRQSMAERLAGGIELTHHDGPGTKAEPGSFAFSTDPSALGDCDAVLVCVKSGATAGAGETLAGVLREGAAVVSMQNGVSNAAILRGKLPGHPVLAAMVGFNVAQIGESRFHRGTDGEVVIGDSGIGPDLVSTFRQAGIPAATTADIEGVQWGKLLLNLNNAVNALSGLPLKKQLSERSYRRVLAASMREALAAMKAAGIRPAKIAKAPPRALPRLLETPDWLFTRLAASMLAIDDDARSSMAEDLERGREPEIDFLNGEIVALAVKAGTAAPVNDRLVALVRKASKEKSFAGISGEALVGAVGLT